jgi:ribosome maturation protein Sdo1
MKLTYFIPNNTNRFEMAITEQQAQAMREGKPVTFNDVPNNAILFQIWGVL